MTAGSRGWGPETSLWATLDVNAQYITTSIWGQRLSPSGLLLLCKPSSSQNRFSRIVDNLPRIIIIIKINSIGEEEVVFRVGQIERAQDPAFHLV